MSIASSLGRCLTGLVLALGAGSLVSTALADDMMSASPVGNQPPLAPFVLPQIKEDPNPLIIQGPAGEIFRFVRTGASTCGRYLMAKATIPPGGGPMPHIHHWTDEFFVMPEGGFTLFLGTQLYPSSMLEPGRNAPKDHIALVATQPG